MAISNERFKTLFLNWWERTEKDLTLSEMEDLCRDIGTTRAEFIELVSQSNEFISKDGWTPEVEANEKVNIEGVGVGDSDQTIFEATLTRLGIPYTWKESNDSKGRWIDVKMVDKEKSYEEDIVAALVHFNKEGGLMGIF